jgi:hypothetical protein
MTKYEFQVINRQDYFRDTFEQKLNKLGEQGWSVVGYDTEVILQREILTQDSDYIGLEPLQL